MMNVDQPFRPCIFCNKPAFGDGSEYAGEHGRYYHRRCLVRAEDEARYPQTVGNYVPYLDPVHHMDLVQKMNEVLLEKARLEQQLISFDDLKKELEQRKEKEKQLSSKLAEQELILAEQRTELEKLKEKSEDEIQKRNHTIEQLEAKNGQLRAVVSERESKVGNVVLGRDQQPVSSDNLKKELEQRKDKEKQTGSVVNLDEETWTIWVELSRITFPLHVKPSNTIRDVMVMIEKKECIAVRDQRLFPAGRQLKEQSYTLAAYGLTDNSVIDLLVI